MIPTKDKPRTESAPSLEVDYSPAGRDTLAQIVGELAPERAAPAPAPESVASEPTLTVSEAFVERDTIAAIHAELVADAPPAAAPEAAVAPPEASVRAVPRPTPTPSAAPTELFQLLTFVVRGGDVSRLASERARRQFVEHTLLTRLPVASIDDVERIDASPWTEQQSVVLRVLCKISASGS